MVLVATPHFLLAAISAAESKAVLMTESRRSPTVSRMSTSNRTLRGIALYMLGDCSHSPTVATVSEAPERSIVVVFVLVR
jgi:hypothetical protein